MLDTFQGRVKPWLDACFGPEIAGDRVERNHRFLEEALELVQACGCSQDEAHRLVDYVFDRPVGETQQEVGGVMVTLAALCLANAQDMAFCGELELTRVWTKVEAIRAKQAAKPKIGPLPGPAMSLSYHINGRKKDGPKMPTGWVETHWERFDYVECSIWAKPTADLTEEDRDILRWSGTRPEGWMTPMSSAERERVRDALPLPGRAPETGIGE